MISKNKKKKKKKDFEHMPGLRISDRDCQPILKSWKYELTKSSSKSFAFKRSTSINVRSTLTESKKGGIRG